MFSMKVILKKTQRWEWTFNSPSWKTHITVHRHIINNSIGPCLCLCCQERKNGNRANEPINRNVPSKGLTRFHCVKLPLPLYMFFVSFFFALLFVCFRMQKVIPNISLSSLLFLTIFYYFYFIFFTVQWLSTPGLLSLPTVLHRIPLPPCLQECVPANTPHSLEAQDSEARLGNPCAFVSGWASDLLLYATLLVSQYMRHLRDPG